MMEKGNSSNLKRQWWQAVLKVAGVQRVARPKRNGFVIAIGMQDPEHHRLPASQASTSLRAAECLRAWSVMYSHDHKAQMLQGSTVLPGWQKPPGTSCGYYAEGGPPVQLGEWEFRS